MEYVVLVGGVATLAIPAVDGLRRSLATSLERATARLAESTLAEPQDPEAAGDPPPSGSLPAGDADTPAATTPAASTPTADTPPAAEAPSAPASSGPPRTTAVAARAPRRLTLLAGPGGARLGQLEADTELRILESRDDHCRVQTADGRRGWVSQDDLPLPPTPAGSIRLSFTDPQPGISHYQVHYGTSPGQYDRWVPLDPELRLTVLSGLESGTRYYLVLKAVDYQGLVSGPSPEVSKVVE